MKIDKSVLKSIQAHPGSLRIAVAAGKGGVGKSTVSYMLANSLQKCGLRVGVLDLDIQGPSVAILAGLASSEELTPQEKGGVFYVSLGAVSDSVHLMRGPMVSQVTKQLLQIPWPKLDVLILDYPPGTGDIHLTVSQMLTLDSAILVTSPQRVAQADVERCYQMFQTLQVPLLGILENMSYFLCKCGEKHWIFGKQSLSQTLNLPELGEIAIQQAIAQGCDEGGQVLELPDEVLSSILNKFGVLVAPKEGLGKFKLKWRGNAQHQ